MTLAPRIQRCEEANAQNSHSLEKIGTDLDVVKREVHEIKVVLRERDKLGSFLQTAFVSILAGIGLQFVAAVWWASTITSKMESVGATLSEHRTQIQKHQEIIYKNPTHRQQND